MISNARISMIVLSTLALSVALTRCSPLSVSQSRLHTTPSGGGAGGTSPSTGSIAPIGDLQPAQVRALTSTPASVHDSSDAAYSSLPARQRFTITPENEKQKAGFETFKNTRSIMLEFENDNFAPDECKVFLGVALREHEINSLNQDGHQLATDCSQLSDGKWKFSVSDGVSADTWKSVADSLTSITVYLTTDPKIKLASTPKKP